MTYIMRSVHSISPLKLAFHVAERGIANWHTLTPRGIRVTTAYGWKCLLYHNH